jgi:hypothetical protein
MAEKPVRCLPRRLFGRLLPCLLSNRLLVFDGLLQPHKPVAPVRQHHTDRLRVVFVAHQVRAAKYGHRLVVGDEAPLHQEMLQIEIEELVRLADGVQGFRELRSRDSGSPATADPSSRKYVPVPLHFWLRRDSVTGITYV